MSKHWKFRPFDLDQVRFLENEAKIPAVLAQILCARGIIDPSQKDPKHLQEFVQEFLDPKLASLRKPETLPGCMEVAELVLNALRNNRKITVYGDYDVDGMTGTAILVKAVRLLSETPDHVDYFIPDRINDGYGLNDETLKRLATEGTEVVVTVDCGISAYEETKTAKSLGIELLITDHHTPGPELPEVVAITHPQLVRWRGKLWSPNAPELSEFLKTRQEDQKDQDNPDEPQSYPFIGLSGATVAFKVAWALGLLVSGEPKVTPQYQKFLLEAMGLATMGTVADVVPLVDENRILVRFGLEKSLVEHLSLGLRELMNVAKINREKTPTTETIGFQLAPRLNAAGRMGKAMLGVELLLTSDPKRAKDLAKEISDLNDERQKLERKIQKEAESQIQNLYSPNDAAFVLASKDMPKKESLKGETDSKDWHPGIIGIVAGRLSEHYRRPVVVISSQGQGTGSARGIVGFNLYEALEACEEHLERFGGHPSAAGLGIKDENIDAFRKAFVGYFHEETNNSEERRTDDLLVDAWIDEKRWKNESNRSKGFKYLHSIKFAAFNFAALNLENVRQLEKLAPFGCENRRPILCSSKVYLESPARRMGAKDQHFSATFLQDGVALRGFAFGRGAWVDEMNRHGCNCPFSIAFHVVLNSLVGRTKVELQVLDWRLSKK